MLIVGAGGFAKELVQVFEDSDEKEEIFFYDDLNDDVPNFMFEKFKLLRTTDEAKKLFSEVSKKFVLGIGNPILRKKMTDKMTGIGGQLTSAISPNAFTGNFEVSIGNGATILDGAKISNQVKIGEALLMYYNAVITHDAVIGNYVEISPGAQILGNVKIGNNCQIGALSCILPNVIIGDNVVIGAGAVVTENFPDGVVIAGIPAKIIKR